MTERDLLALAISFLYPALLLAAAEVIRRLAGWPAQFTRKLVHVGAGMWVFATLALFDSWWAALIPTTAFVLINYVSAKRTLIPAMDAARGEGLGTVWFMVSFSLLLAWLWPQGRPHLAAAAMMALTWGDAAASLVGRRFGRHKYVISGQTRSLEGSLACAVFTLLSVAPTLFFMAPQRYTLAGALVAGALAALLATLLEMIPARGLDNLTVPLGSAFLLWLLETGAVSSGAVALGLGLGVLIALPAYRAGLLDLGGAAGAVLSGTVIFAAGGLVWGLLLIFFFISSSLLTRYGRRSPQKRLAATTFAKGGRRDLAQVLANGGLAAVLAVLYSVASPEWRLLLFGVFTATLAAVTADTWATEVGVLSLRPPRLITNGQVVAPGTSGAVSALGTLGAAAGGLLIGLLAWLLEALLGGQHLPWLVFAGVVGGLAGGFADSLLGATLQGVYWCPACNRETERSVHACGTRTELRRGMPWLDNEAVNFACSLVGALAGLLVALFWRL